MSEYIIDMSNSSYQSKSGLLCADVEQLHEEIVRCRDCKHMHTVRDWLGMDVDECWLHADRESGALGKERTEPNGFCAWGERKTINKTGDSVTHSSSKVVGE